MSIIYGPVPSWRLGRSLGIDMVSTRYKTCSFDCVYCQLGNTVNKQVVREEFVPLASLQRELDSLPEVAVDYVTFSGIGEPTLAINIGEAIRMARRSLHLPIAVLTNSSLLPEIEVRQQLAGADTVIAKLDASDNDLLRLINRPVMGLSIHRLVEGIKSFRSMFKGKLAIQVMFTHMNQGQAFEIAEIVKEMAVDEVQINTPLRPCPIKPLHPANIDQISRAFREIKYVTTVYGASKPAIAALNQRETQRRRPETHEI